MKKTQRRKTIKLKSQKSVEEKDELANLRRDIQNYNKSHHNVKNHHWEVVQSLCQEKVDTLDYNLDKLQDFIKGQAHSLYYNRKVDFLNLIVDKSAQDEKDLQKFLKKTESSEQANFDKSIEDLRQLMIKYDIKHPLRGEEQVSTLCNLFVSSFEDHDHKLKQTFDKKIMGLAGGPNSFFGYKKDLRGIFDFSEIRSEKYQAELHQKYSKQRTILKYRIYGRPGVTQREFDKLIDWGIVKRKHSEFHRKVRVKKRTRKQVTHSDGRVSIRSSEMSGSEPSNYTYKSIAEYEDNREGDPIFKNQGFEIMPLDPVMFGKRKKGHTRSVAKSTHLMNMDKLFLNQESSFETLGGATYVNSGRVAGGGDSQQFPQIQQAKESLIMSNEFMPSSMRQKLNNSVLLDNASYLNEDSKRIIENFSSQKKSRNVPITTQNSKENKPGGFTSSPDISKEFASFQTIQGNEQQYLSSQPDAPPTKESLPILKFKKQRAANKPQAKTRILAPHLANKVGIPSHMKHPDDKLNLMNQFLLNDRSSGYMSPRGSPPIFGDNNIESIQEATRIRIGSELDFDRGSSKNDAILVSNQNDPTEQPATSNFKNRVSSIVSNNRANKQEFFPSLNPSSGGGPSTNHAPVGDQFRMKPVQVHFLVDKQTGRNLRLKEKNGMLTTNLQPAHQTVVAPSRGASRSLAFKEAQKQTYRFHERKPFVPPPIHRQCDVSKSLNFDTNNFSLASSQMTTYKRGRQSHLGKLSPHREPPKQQSAAKTVRLRKLKPDDTISKKREVAIKSNLERREMGGGRLNKLFTDRVPTVRDDDIRSLIQRYPIAEKEPSEENWSQYFNPVKGVKGGDDMDSESIQSLANRMDHSPPVMNITQDSRVGDSQSPNARAPLVTTSHKSEKATFKKNMKMKDMKKQLDFLSKNIDRIGRESKDFYRNFLTTLVTQNFRDQELNKISDNLKEIDFAEAETLAGMYEYRLKDENEKIMVSMEVAKEYREGKIDPRKGV